MNKNNYFFAYFINSYSNAISNLCLLYRYKKGTIPGPNFTEKSRFFGVKNFRTKTFPKFTCMKYGLVRVTLKMSANTRARAV